MAYPGRGSSQRFVTSLRILAVSKYFNIASFLLLYRWLQMDQNSCHYLLHPRSHHSVCHPGPHPVPRLLQVGAGGPSDAARAPGAALHLPALPADPTAAAVHHALQPPLQTRGEEEKEVAGSGGGTHQPGLHLVLTLRWWSPLGQTSPSSWLQLFPEHWLLQGKMELVGVHSPAAPSHSSGSSLGQPGVSSVQGLSPRKMDF